jgi:hypothetical protein
VADVEVVGGVVDNRKGFGKEVKDTALQRY